MCPRRRAGAGEFQDPLGAPDRAYESEEFLYLHSRSQKILCSCKRVSRGLLSQSTITAAAPRRCRLQRRRRAEPSRAAATTNEELAASREGVRLRMGRADKRTSLASGSVLKGEFSTPSETHVENTRAGRFVDWEHVLHGENSRGSGRVPEYICIYKHVYDFFARDRWI